MSAEETPSGHAPGTVDVSVVIPTFARPELLAVALRCVRRQSVQPKETLVINNGPDRLPPLDELQAPGVKVMEMLPFAGAAQARNFGASLARGDYIAFLDDDDLWEDEYLKKVTDRIATTQADCIIARLDQMLGDETRPYKLYDPLRTQQILVRNPGVTGSSTVVRRSAFFAVGGYDPRLVPSEDKSLVLELLLKGFSVCAAPHAQAIMRQHQGARLSSPEYLAEGIRQFLRKYGWLMTPGERAFNRFKIAKHRYRMRHQVRFLAAAAAHRTVYRAWLRSSDLNQYGGEIPALAHNGQARPGRG
jgi:glycosyltransferase involved in cell wall biosynthesis